MAKTCNHLPPLWVLSTWLSLRATLGAVSPLVLILRLFIGINHLNYSHHAKLIWHSSPLTSWQSSTRTVRAILLTIWSSLTLSTKKRRSLTTYSLTLTSINKTSSDLRSSDLLNFIRYRSLPKYLSKFLKVLAIRQLVWRQTKIPLLSQKPRVRQLKRWPIPRGSKRPRRAVKMFIRTVSESSYLSMHKQLSISSRASYIVQ